jgi:hypothetical protein
MLPALVDVCQLPTRSRAPSDDGRMLFGNFSSFFGAKLLVSFVFRLTGFLCLSDIISTIL